MSIIFFILFLPVLLRVYIISVEYKLFKRNFYGYKDLKDLFKNIDFIDITLKKEILKIYKLHRITQVLFYFSFPLILFIMSILWGWWN